MACFGLHHIAIEQHTEHNPTEIHFYTVSLWCLYLRWDWMNSQVKMVKPLYIYVVPNCVIVHYFVPKLQIYFFPVPVNLGTVYVVKATTKR